MEKYKIGFMMDDLIVAELPKLPDKGDFISFFYRGKKYERKVIGYSYELDAKFKFAGMKIIVD